MSNATKDLFGDSPSPSSGDESPLISEIQVGNEQRESAENVEINGDEDAGLADLFGEVSECVSGSSAD